MKFSKLILGALIFALALQACNGDDITEQEKRSDLSAGASTTYTFTKVAFDTPSDWLKGAQEKRFLSGDGIYDAPRNSGNVMNGGLGPLYSGYACAGCHDGAGRTLPTLHSDGGTGHNGYSVFLVDFMTTDKQFLHDYGEVLHDQAIYGHKPEGKLSVTYTETEHSFPDGEKYKLITPSYQITDWSGTTTAAYEMSVRIPLRHVGMGMMMAVDREMIKELATKKYESGVSGKVNYVNGKVGLVGHKAQNTDLTVEVSFASDIGAMNSRFPNPSKLINGRMPDEDQSDQVSDEDMADVDFYLHTLGVPARRNVNDPVVIRGEEMFMKAKCQECHVQTLRTRPEGATLIDGTHLPELGNQEIHPYTDYLVHDMGPALADKVKNGEAEGYEWRTTPLWGIGLQNLVNGHQTFLHDGRARNFIEAIMWHGGEAETSKKIFENMPKADRDALLKFLHSL